MDILTQTNPFSPQYKYVACRISTASSHFLALSPPLPFPSLPFPAPCLRLQKPHRKCCRRTGGSFRDGLNWPVIRPTTNTTLVIFLFLLSEHSRNVTCLLSLKFLQSLCPSPPPLPLTTITETSITTTMHDS